MIAPTFARMRTFTLPISGMTCQGCVAAATKALSAVPGVQRVDVRLTEQDAVITADDTILNDNLDAALARVGFRRGPETTLA